MADRPIWDYPMAAAQIAAREGYPSDVAYAVLSSLGMQVSREDFQRLYGQATLSADLVDPTGDLPLDQLPPQDLIQHRSTVTSSGYQYQLSVSVTDQESGQDYEIPYSVRTDSLIQPGEAIDAAIVSQRLRAPDYNFKVLDARLTGVYQLIPEMGGATG